ncbi:hypothetical protein NCU16680 [Neurospora crassa OR74A]|uniref:Uncharacterized protein n=1 Tax=Neurospora crassa (strain ATCC 24698 / 74-OR23-1A / CBS 708.71 / DSM 1257 / FGSC 987) TaxID=367110 RepID=U9W534_NEUCR|nr:hypothetical protein NCU16680 [Neurospora crassa OR74A]ESA43354.1 hypothetical protein NCU16680 [Neurospora crassa OR74A]|eukprot:XP_011394053.1 hypothetical protein NCU16680 [Neurospora crassa OR74A]
MQRDREGEHFGWGRKSAAEACFVQPATHKRTIDPGDNPINFRNHAFWDKSWQNRPKDSSKVSPQFRTYNSPEMFNPRSKINTPKHHEGNPSPTYDWISEAPVSSPLTTGNRTGPVAKPSSISGHRMTARQLFDQYGITPPPG